MKKVTKLLSMLLLVALCMSLFGGVNAFADHTVTVTATQLDKTPDHEGSVRFQITTDPAEDISEIYVNSVEWNCQGDTYDCYDFSYANGIVTVPGSDWSVVTQTHIYVDGGNSAMFVKPGEPGTTTLYIHDPVVPTVTATETTTAGTSFTVEPVDSLQYIYGYNSNGNTLVNYTKNGNTVVIPNASSYSRIEFYFDPAVCTTDCVVVYGADLPLAPDSDFIVSSANAKSYYTYSKASDVYTYTYTNPDDYTITKITANDVEITGWNAKNGTITIRGAEFADSTTSTNYYLGFYAENKISGNEKYDVNNFYIQKTANMNVDEITVNGLNVNGYVQYSDTAVWFKTNYNLLADPDALKLYNTKTGTNVALPSGAFTVDTTYNDEYTVTFTNDFLDSLPVATYSVRVYYNSTYSSQYKTPGSLSVGTTGTSSVSGFDSTLKFTNSNVSETEYKWYNGSILPELYSPIFMIQGGYLQMSSNGGKSWSNVGINDYVIVLENGNRTVNAYLGENFMNSLNADTIYYFRAYLPSGSILSNGSKTTSQLYSNSVIITTGPTLSAVDTNKHVINSTKNLQFRSSEKIAKDTSGYYKVYVGNIQLTDANYVSVSNDGKYITLSPEFLNGRTAGQTYTLTVYTESGEKLSTTFQILTTAQAASSPKTGDVSMMGLWSALLILSAMSAVVIVPKLRKQYR